MSTLQTLALAGQHTPPVHPATDEHGVTMLDESFWRNAEQRRRERQARVAVSSMEVRSYFATFGASGREDQHRAYADLYGFESVAEGWSNGYTSWAKISYALNALVDANAGRTITNRKMVVLRSETVWTTTATRTPLPQVQAVLAALDAGFTGWGLRFGPVPSWSPRIQSDGTVVRLRPVTTERPAEVRYVPTVEPMLPDWHNPYQLDGGFVILADTPHYNFRKPGVEGLSVLVDHEGRMHLVYWVTDKFSFRRNGRPGPDGRPTIYTAHQVGKKPLSVKSYGFSEDHEDVLADMTRVAQAMTDTAVEARSSNLLPFMAADLVAHTSRDRDVAAHEISGSHAWLAAVADQRQSGETYRPRGATADD